MCGRFTTIFTFKELRDEFRPEKVAGGFEKSFHRSYNVSPQQTVPVVYSDDGGKEGDAKAQVTLDMFRWGLIPSWAKDPKTVHNPINVRAEGINEKPMFKNIVTRKRCLIPASGFYEWTKPGITSKEGDPKRPFYLQVKDRPLFAFAGIWDSWKSPKDDIVNTCSIITTTPNATVKPIHDRMPVILQKEDEARWLDPSLQDREEIASFLTPYPATKMQAYEISTYVNKPENDTAEALRPVEKKEVRTLKSFSK